MNSGSLSWGVFGAVAVLIVGVISYRSGYESGVVNNPDWLNHVIASDAQRAADRADEPADRYEFCDDMIDDVLGVLSRESLDDQQALDAN